MISLAVNLRDKRVLGVGEGSEYEAVVGILRRDGALLTLLTGSDVYRRSLLTPRPFMLVIGTQCGDLGATLRQAALERDILVLELDQTTPAPGGAIRSL